MQLHFLIKLFYIHNDNNYIKLCKIKDNKYQEDIILKTKNGYHDSRHILGISYLPLR